MPASVRALTCRRPGRVVWRNERDGLTFATATGRRPDVRGRLQSAFFGQVVYYFTRVLVGDVVVACRDPVR